MNAEVFNRLLLEGDFNAIYQITTALGRIICTSAPYAIGITDTAIIGLWKVQGTKKYLKVVFSSRLTLVEEGGERNLYRFIITAMVIKEGRDVTRIISRQFNRNLPVPTDLPPPSPPPP